MIDFKEHPWIVKLALIVISFLSGAGIIGAAWGIGSQAVLQVLEHQTENLENFHNFTASVSSVVDGDTIKVYIDGQLDTEETLRLIGVDTPETVHPALPVQFFGPEATAFTKLMCENKKVRLFLPKAGDMRGRYGRLLVYVELENKQILNEQIIVQGFGYSYTKYPHEKTKLYNELERQARNAKRGLWASVKFEDLPEWLRIANPDILK
ncbi:hypothetical protein LCGC14_1189200 [marine sediment metagenome]|uniref:TNase-like domain-containing protein n=1 Tax=marine sediment metagenome TaxID=412755 RepID=A0A0F9PQB8_9ZZZZ